ncbi:MAG: DUF1236 domain-containing protein [bacterium]
MIRHIKLSVIALVAALNTGAAVAQSVGPTESISPGGDVNQTLALTAAQKDAIYKSVVKDKTHRPTAQFSTAIGAPVPPSLELRALPDEAVADNPSAKFFQYTRVQDKVVVVDPTRMRVVEVIDGLSRR